MRQILRAMLRATPLALAVAFAPAAAQEGQAPSGLSQWQPAVLPMAKSASFASKATGHTYRIQVGKIGPEPEGGYPVVYVLDGDAMFPAALLHAAALSMQPQDNAPASVLIVGVGYSDKSLLDMNARAADYTPPSDDYSDTGDAYAKRFGEADRFLAFLNDELKPAIARDYPVDRKNQILLGHSYGALFGLYALFSQPEGFSSYIISSPSIWWNKSRILAYFEKFKDAQKHIHVPLRVRITSGSLEQTPSATARSDDKRVRMLNSRRMVSNACAMAASLDALANPDIHIDYMNYPHETHGTVIMRAIADGISYALSGQALSREETSMDEGCP